MPLEDHLPTLVDGALNGWDVDLRIAGADQPDLRRRSGGEGDRDRKRKSGEPGEFADVHVNPPLNRAHGRQRQIETKVVAAAHGLVLEAGNCASAGRGQPLRICRKQSVRCFPHAGTGRVVPRGARAAASAAR